MDQKPKRHCWECRRRCLVCDFTQPACKRCSSSGTVCPGYSDAKPSRLRWLAPGRVTARRRKQKHTHSDSTSETSHDCEETAPAAVELFQAWGDVAIPRFDGKTDFCHLLDAADYYNTYIYQELVPIRRLGPNPTIYPLLPIHLRVATAFPDHIRLSLICVTLSHRINRTRDSHQAAALAETYYRYRGLIIRSLREDIDLEQRRTSDLVLAGIMTLLLIEIQQGALSDWRQHLHGIQKLITLRGGLRAIAGSQHLAAALLCFICLAVIGNTTCPASDLAMAQWHLDELDFILNEYSGSIFPFPMCPSLIFAEIIKINHLRMRAFRSGLYDDEGLSDEAYGILSRIDDFSTEQWAWSKPCSHEEWLLVGNIYKAATTIYCISSLQSLSILPLTGPLRFRCTALGKLLHAFLAKALSSPGIGGFLLWPLVMLGMEAANGCSVSRAFVEQQLPKMSRHVGSYAPLAAKAVLERFWASKETGWDLCFDRPYVFATQIAVDLSRLSPP